MLEQALEGQGSGESAIADDYPIVREEPASAFLTGVSVTGFRGIGPSAELHVSPGPGLTLVIGRNGTGKSSFAEGLEFALTGQNSRWDKKAKEWENGWRNLHHEGPPSIEARFVVDGLAGEARVSRRWAEADASLEAHAFETEVSGERTDGLQALAWDAPIETHRPLLSHGQLGEIVERGPSARFDAMAAGLGLEQITEAREELRQRRLTDDATVSGARDTLEPILQDLQQSADERAQRCFEALSTEPWNLSGVGDVLSGALDEEGDRPLKVLRGLIALERPSLEETERLCEQLAVAQRGLDAVEGSDAAQAQRLARTLAAALSAHEHDGDQPCPVCRQGSLDAAWASEAREQLKTLRREARAVRDAQAARDKALDAVTQFCTKAPRVLAQAEGVGVDASSTSAAWRSWAGTTDDEPELPEVADRLVERGESLRAAIEELQGRARRELMRREDLWRPLAQRLSEWLSQGRDAQRVVPRLGVVSEAESWLGSVEQDVRDERFRPVAERAQRYWEMMRERSSVSLESLGLSGRANSRRLNLAVVVDGAGAAALGVMSQGELNVLSLSLFLARAMLPESPFRFLVIDDPVQAMDPAKVDGLACVLEEVGRERQVVVFTHDTRLSAAARQMDVEARVIEISRDLNSVVTCRPVDGPVRKYLDDARAVLRTKEATEETKWRVIPGFCRQALEAACVEGIRRRRAATGRDLSVVEEDISRARTLEEKFGILLFNNAEPGADLLTALSEEFGANARQVVEDCEGGSHGVKPSTSLSTLINRTQSLADKLRKP